MCFFSELFYNSILLLCCLVSGSSTMLNNNDGDNNNNNAEDELHQIGSNRPACASCKHQRKKCIEGDCVMWRHFPASKMDEFLGVHKVFGLSNVTKKIKSLDDVAQQDESIKSFLWEAKLWQENPVHGPLGEYKKLEQQLKEEQRKNKPQIVQLPDVPQLPTTITTSESITRYLPPLAVNHNNMVAPRENITNNTNHNQQDYNMLNSSVPNYTNLLQWNGRGGPTQGITSNGQDFINIGGGNNLSGFGNFPCNYNRPIEQIRNDFIPRLQGIVHQPATYNNGAHHVQLHQQRFQYNNVDLCQGRRRKEQSDPFVSPIGIRHVRGRGIGPSITSSSLAGPIITTSSSLAGPIIRHGPIISSCSSGSFVDSIIANATRTMVNPSVHRGHVEDGRNQRAEDVATVLQDFLNYNPNDLPGEHKHLNDTKDGSTSKRV